MLTYIGIATLTLGASAIGTFAGFGSSTVMLPIILLFFPLGESLLFVGAVHLLIGIWKTALYRQGFHWKLILGFGLPGVACSIFGAHLATAVNQQHVERVVGGLLIGYAIILLAKPRLHLKKTGITTAIGGASSGFLAGLSGIGGPVQTAFLSAFNAPRAVLLATMGMLAVGIDVARLTTYLINDVTLPSVLIWSIIIGIPMTFIGSEIAKNISGKLSPHFFHSLVAFILLGVGIKFLFF